MTHIRRLLDIVACTTFFGGSSSPKPPGRPVLNEPGSVEPLSGLDSAGSTEKKSTANGVKSPKTDGDSVTAMMCPPPRLGQFYDFFSLSHLTPPIQCKLKYVLLYICMHGFISGFNRSYI